jgi:hypothetical protein
MEQNTKEQNASKTIADFLNKPWKLMSAIAITAIIGGVAVSGGYVGWRCGSLNECVLLRKEDIPKSLSIKGKWFYETKTSGVALQFDALKCMSILGTAEISQDAASNEFDVVNATRLACIDPKSQAIETNVGWERINAAVLPESRKIIVSLITRDLSPRIGYIEGAIPENITGDYSHSLPSDVHCPLVKT